MSSPKSSGKLQAPPVGCENYRFLLLFSGPVDPDGFQEVLGRGRRLKNSERMAELIQAEGEDDSHNPPRRRPNHHRRSNRKSKKTPTPLLDDNTFTSLLSDADDNDFDGESGPETGSDSDSETSGLDSDVNIVKEITNEEVSVLDILLKQPDYSLSSSWHPLCQQRLSHHQVAVPIQMLATYGRKVTHRKKVRNVPRVQL